MIIEKAEGNPFFLEELTRVVIEQHDAETDVQVPDTIQGVLSARIDRLPEPHKHLLQTASVLGREFSPRLLEAIWNGSDPLDALLQELKRLEFLYERSGAEEPIFVFRHALTQAVAYDSLLTTRRQSLHAAIGWALETLYADGLEAVYDRLAYHYAKANEAAKAVVYLTRVATQAAQGHAHAEALLTLQEALSHVEGLPAATRDRQYMELLLQQGQSLFRLGRIQERLELLQGAQERMQRLQEPVLAGSYYWLLASTYSMLGKHEEAAQSAQLALEAATQCGDRVTMGKVHRILARETV